MAAYWPYCRRAFTGCTVEDPPEKRAAQYANVKRGLQPLLAGETDFVAAMATVVCELHNAFEYFDWTGFYRRCADGTLLVGPYQGPHGCLRIRPGDGVCGAAAQAKATQLVRDVSAFPGHIACMVSSKSEMAVPLVGSDGAVLAVLDVISDTPAAFTEVDRQHVEALCADLCARRWASGAETDGSRARL
mmetsp:Transcript_30543/g.79040  ORF Transcript_30543/g.79040 Transcript_30543/m.79040 type:complete len:189 (-) Transcript_30543:377-943(-)|eukprot:jgi/Tetstr1/432031/TSEL_021504.t1